MTAAPPPAGLTLAPWAALLTHQPTPAEAAALDAWVAALAPDDTACLIYTSGTSGPPRGVMQTHRGILANCRDAAALLARAGLSGDGAGGTGSGDEPRGLSCPSLPLSHAYEHTGGQWPAAADRRHHPTTLPGSTGWHATSPRCGRR